MADEANSPDNATPSDAERVVDDTLMAVQVRRSPRFAVFCALGAVLGALVALILTFTFDGWTEKSPDTGIVYTQMQVFGFLVLPGIVIGVVVGGVVALLIDRFLSRRPHEHIADREHTRLMP